MNYSLTYFFSERAIRAMETIAFAARKDDVNGQDRQ